VNPHYKGESSFNLAGAGPNLARCGAFPENVELSFTGGGIDTEGGYNTAVFSACTNTTTNLVFDLKATDTYAGSGDSVFIEGDPFVKHTLAQYADSKSLKGYELVGWLGEVYVKLL
jgi:hypothetical protein